MSFHVPNKYRIKEGAAGSDDSIGNAGAFLIPMPHNQRVYVIASDGLGWEHVSVSRRDHPPSWDEMCRIKSLFWDDEDCVVQFHPPRSEYVNNHPNCLHLWRKVGYDFPLPDSVLVGIKEAA